MTPYWYLLPTTAMAVVLAGGVAPAFAATDLGHSTNGVAPGARGLQVAGAYQGNYPMSGMTTLWTFDGRTFVVHGQPGSPPRPANDNHAPQSGNFGEQHGPFI